MGTSNPSNFSDYSESSKGSSEQDDSNGPNQGDKCTRSIGDILLEEIAHFDFYKSLKNLPTIGTEVSLKKEITNGRLIIEVNGTSIGCLPTKYNYLRACMEIGFQYSGIVTNSSNSPVPKVVIDLGLKK